MRLVAVLTVLAGLAFGVPTAQALTARFDFSRDLGAEILDPVVLPNRAYVLDIVHPQAPKSRLRIAVLTRTGHRRAVQQFDRLLARLHDYGSDYDPLPSFLATKRWIAVAVPGHEECGESAFPCSDVNGTLEVAHPNGPVRVIARCRHGGETPTPLAMSGAILAYTACGRGAMVIDLDRPRRPGRHLSTVDGPVTLAGDYVASATPSPTVINWRTGTTVLRFPATPHAGAADLALDRDGTLYAVTTPAGADSDPVSLCGIRQTQIVWASPREPQAHTVDGAEPCASTLSLHAEKLLYVQRVPSEGTFAVGLPAVIDVHGGRPPQLFRASPDVRFAADGQVQLAVTSCPGGPIVSFYTLTHLLVAGGPLEPKCPREAHHREPRIERAQAAAGGAGRRGRSGAAEYGASVRSSAIAIQLPTGIRSMNARPR